MRRPLLFFACLAALSTPLIRAEGLPDLGDAAQAELSPQAEKKIGESIMRDIRSKEPSYLDDVELEAYLNQLGRRLTTHLDGPYTGTGAGFSFFVLRDPSINAFALPGGYIGVHTGLLLAAQTESELAGVLAHEISHVTQHHIARGSSQQGQSYATMLAAIALAILAGRNNPDLAQGALAAGKAATLQSQLSYSRDYEREADRHGLQLLEKSGFDPHGMSSFFLRLQRSSRASERGTPAYLLTHPLTTERIADMENREQSLPARQVADSPGFALVRAKLRAELGTPQEAVADFESLLNEKKSLSETAARYGLARALLRAGKLDGAEAQLQQLRRLKTQSAQSAMIETLAAELRVQRGDAPGAEKILMSAALTYPQDRAVAYALVDAQLQAGHARQALQTSISDLRSNPEDARMYALQAKVCAHLGLALQEHRAQGEAYALLGLLEPAIEQFEFAQKAADGNFYERSQVDARLRELKRLRQEEALEKRK